MAKKNKTYLLMIIPALVVFIAFHTFPILQVIFYSFTDYRGYGTWDFAGIKNYINVFQDGRVLNAYGFTFKLAIVSTIIVNIISILIAMGLNAKIKFRKSLRAIYFLPYILSLLIIGYIFKFMFTNLLPQLGQALGWEFLSTNILGSSDLAWFGIRSEERRVGKE